MSELTINVATENFEGAAGLAEAKLHGLDTDKIQHVNLELEALRKSGFLGEEYSILPYTRRS